MVKLTGDKLTIEHIEKAKAMAREAKPLPTVVRDGVEYVKLEGIRFVEGVGHNRQARRRDERERAAARKKLAQWAQRGGK